MTRNLNPSQFALPGMEHLAHPLAGYVAEGARFEFRSQRVKPRSTVTDLPNDPERVGQPHTHTLEAFHGEKPIGALDWRGSHTARTAAGSFPGEIKWVGRAEMKAEDVYRDTEAGVWRERNAPPRYPGIMTAMFRAGHEMPLGQSTVPIHSHDRTWQGEHWAQSVGDYGIGMPEVGDDEWRPPKGVHPYEKKAKKARKKAKRAGRLPTGQQVIPGVGEVG